MHFLEAGSHTHLTLGRGDKSTLRVVAIKELLEPWPSKISIVEGKYIECGLNDASRWLSGNAWANRGVVLRRQTPRKRAEGGVSNNASRNSKEARARQYTGDQLRNLYYY